VAESLVTVRFFVARPLNDGAWTGTFPAETVIARLHDLNPERGEADVPMGATVVSSRVKKKGDPAHVAFYALRDHAFPEIELNGQIKPLDVEDEARVAEPSHVCFFDGGVIGVLASTGPKHGQIGKYLQVKAGVAVMYEALLREEFFQRIERQEEVQLLRFTVEAGNIPAIAATAANVAGALQTLQDYFGGQTVELVFRGGRSIPTKQQLSYGAKKFFRRPKKGDDPVTSHLKTAVVGGRSPEGDPEMIRLLEDQITVTRPVDKVGRRIKDAEARRILLNAYSSAHREIQTALEATAG